MQHFTEQDKSYEAVMHKVRRKYGDSARVLTYRTVRLGGFLGLFAQEGIEVSGLIGNVYSSEKRVSDVFQFEEEKRRVIAAASRKESATSIHSAPPQTSAGARGVSTPYGAAASVAPTASSQSAAIQASNRQAQAESAAIGVQTKAEIAEVMKELKDIQKKLDVAAVTGPVARPQDIHPSLGRIEELLENNEFSPSYIRGIMDKIRQTFSLEDLENFSVLQHTVLEWIGEKIVIYRENEEKKPRIFILVGPTGVGKTTTIAKLAAVHSLGMNQGPAGQSVRSKNVRIVTIDNYRIAAKQQIETYADIIGIPVSCVETFQDLEKTAALYQDADLVLVDTVGRSPRDFERLASMRTFVGGFGGETEIHLAVSASTKASDLREILRQFDSFDYQSVILTKIDETTRIGNVLSALAEKNKPISYITDGQSVPQDLQRASVGRLLMTMEGFRVNRERMEAKFAPENSGRTAEEVGRKDRNAGNRIRFAGVAS